MYQKRELKALRLLNRENGIKKINKLHYRVRSASSDDVWYDVTRSYGSNKGIRQEGKWNCTCLDSKFRPMHQCKHQLLIFWNKKKVQQEPQDRILPKQSSEVICLKCQGIKVVKDGKRKNKKGDSQKYLCRECGYRFVVNTGFENCKKDPKIICACIDLYCKGMSLRKVSAHVKQFYEVDVSNVSVLRWVRRFGEVVAPLVDSLDPKFGGVYQVDEMMIHVRHEKMEKGHYQWLWNFMDDSTKFLVSSIVSQKREVIDAQRVFQDAKKKTDKTYAVIHDGLPSYDKAFQKEYYTMKKPRVKNIRSISVRNEGLNSIVERTNGTIRAREKVMRGMQNKETAQKIIDALRIHYNFVRVHQSLKKTPAEQAGIDLQLSENKIKDLFELSNRTTS